MHLKVKSSLKSGISSQRVFRVDRDSTIAFMGKDARVYATPALIWHVETVCRDLLLSHLHGTEDSVGTRVEIDHLAPSFEDSEISVEARLVKLSGREATFEISAFDGSEKICRGRHTRFIVDKAQFAARLQKKRSIVSSGT